MDTVYTLNGGLATELERRGYNAEAEPLFGSSFLLTDPNAIISVHKSFLQSGANIITTATYQANIDTLCKYLGITGEVASELIQKSVHLAKMAVAEVQKGRDRDSSKNQERREPTVAGCVGPYAAALRDGSEYHGSYASNMTEDMLMAWHRPRFQSLTQAGAELVAMETIPCAKEGIAVTRLLREFPSTKAWLSFSCKDGQHTCHENDFLEAIQSCLQHDAGQQLVAIGINCSSPTIISDLMQHASVARTNIPFIVYPNSGESWTRECRWSGKDKCYPLSSYVSEWIDLGARYIGGCCRVTPDDIKDIALAVHRNPVKR